MSLDMERLIICIVCYNNEKEVVEYVKQIKEQNLKKIVILICCNSSIDNGYLDHELKKIEIETWVYYPEKNMGYLNGCLYALTRFGGAKDGDWVVISNTDIRIRDKNMLVKIMQKSYKGEVDIIAPKVLLKKGGQNPFLLERPSKIRVWAWKCLQGKWWGLYLLTKLHDIKKEHANLCSESKYIYSAHGSFMICSARMISALISEENNIFMYGEELFISEVARKKSYGIFYDPDYIIEHQESCTTGLVGCKKKAEWYKQSYDYIYRRFF